ncbi:excinuclease ABC subunit UvrA, partial [Candidatus Roizmanbacteria bacterium]|nr:excinuclease ABC subunit UvrA [Candidatus Roizmanbacteria bacterium]
MSDFIKVRGARQHNLKNINVDIPKNKFVVMTGISGSGKSSLAFDTIYAEGQRRYVESLSAYARQFLGIMDKPDVDSIEGLSPSISIDQKAATHNPRSTVGTITEIYDYLRLLFARVGHPHCPQCKREISKMSTDEIIDRILAEILKEIASDKIKPHQFIIYSPIVLQKKGEFKDLFDNLRGKGFFNLRVDGKKTDLNQDINLIKTNRHTIEVATDQFSLSHKEAKEQTFVSSLKTRLSSAVEQAVNLSDGLIILGNEISSQVIKGKEWLYSEKFSCPNCNISLPEIEPRMFSFNSPIGACEKCKGIGTIYAVEPELVLNKNLSIQEGAILPFNKFFFHETWYVRLLKTVAKEEGIDFNIQVSKLPNRQVEILLYGTGKHYHVQGVNRYGKPTTIYEKFDGVIRELERRYFDSQSDLQGMEIQKYMREEECPACKGKKLKPEVLSITVNKKNISDTSELAVDLMI